MSSQDFVMILYYLKKLVQLFSPLNYFIASSLSLLSSSVCRAFENQSDRKKRNREKEILFFLIAPETINALDIFMLLSSNAFTMLCLGICSKTH